MACLRFTCLCLGLCLFSGFSYAESCAPPENLSYTVVAEYPHNTDHFTQGLLFVGDSLVESTGQFGHSKVLRYTPDHQVTEQFVLPEDRFGEGLAWFQQRLWQLTWRAGELRVFRYTPLQLEKTLRYRGEGWGLTNDLEHFYMSDGSDKITVRNEQFEVVRHFTVRSGNMPIRRLNELEWVDEQLYANIWRSNHIARINPQSGCVTAWLDLSTLWPQAQRPPGTDVLNGIAWHPLSGHVWVTGKLWPKLYELQISTPIAAKP